MVKNGQQTGPFTIEQIRAAIASGSVKPDNLAWHDGLPNWTPLSSISEIQGAAPPPVPIPASMPPIPYSTANATSPSWGKFAPHAGSQQNPRPPLPRDSQYDHYQALRDSGALEAIKSSQSAQESSTEKQNASAPPDGWGIASHIFTGIGIVVVVGGFPIILSFASLALGLLLGIVSVGIHAGRRPAKQTGSGSLYFWVLGFIVVIGVIIYAVKTGNLNFNL